MTVKLTDKELSKLRNIQGLVEKYETLISSEKRHRMDLIELILEKNSIDFENKKVELIGNELKVGNE